MPDFTPAAAGRSEPLNVNKDIARLNIVGLVVLLLGLGLFVASWWRVELLQFAGLSVPGGGLCGLVGRILPGHEARLQNLERKLSERKNHR